MKKEKLNYINIYIIINKTDMYKYDLESGAPLFFFYSHKT